MFFRRKIYNLKSVKNIESGVKTKIVCFGDSITWGYSFGAKSILNYPKSLQEKIKKHYQKSKIEVINEGHCGWTSSDAVCYLKNIIKLKPNLIIIMFGINDVMKGIKLKDYLKNIEYIIKVLKKAKIDIIVLSPTKINRKANLKLDIYSNKVLKLAKSKNINFIDIRKIMQQILDIGGFEQNDFISLDTIHLKKDRYKIISNIVYTNIFNKKHYL
ncbi:MAG: GDSL-type esterase/lipase family protein [Patescibacteria group bacterium]